MLSLEIYIMHVAVVKKTGDPHGQTMFNPELGQPHCGSQDNPFCIR